MSLPKAVRKGSQRTKRFGVHDRVACAVEDATGQYTDWAAGTVHRTVLKLSFDSSLDVVTCTSRPPVELLAWVLATMLMSSLLSEPDSCQ